MLRFYKFAPSVLDPVPAKETYQKRSPGRGWPEECPPLRGANSYGWDILANFDMDFRKKKDGSWTLVKDHVIVADWTWNGAQIAPVHAHDEGCNHESDGPPPEPLEQVNAWFWEKNQKLPHKISPNVFRALKNQVKVQTYLFLETDPNEVLWIGDVPNQWRNFRGLSAVVDTDWYPASYPWHCVIELDPREKRVFIPKGTPIARLMTLPRGQFFAKEMQDGQFETFFARSQRWLEENGRGEDPRMRDITGTYSKQQRRSRFDVIF